MASPREDGSRDPRLLLASFSAVSLSSLSLSLSLFLSLFSPYSYTFYDVNFLRSRYFCHKRKKRTRLCHANRDLFPNNRRNSQSTKFQGFALPIVLKFPRDRECTASVPLTSASRSDEVLRARIRLDTSRTTCYMIQL